MPAIPLPPSKTLRSVADAVSLVARADDSSSSFVPIPSTYGSLNSSPSPGVVVGIVLGSVAGFLLLLYIIYAILHGGPVLIPIRGRSSTVGAPSTMGTSTIGTSTLGTSTLGTSTVGASTYESRSALSFRSRRDKKRRSAPSASSRRARSRTETVQVRTRSHRRPGPVVVDPPRTPSPESTVPPRAVQASEVSALSSLDEIVVEEEHTPPRRQSRRYSPERGYRRDSYRDGADPEQYYSRRDSPPRRASRRY
ncbi:hypothetical protein EDB81DRAFT_327198 [Dactylonectria macrodidyma]|uniref:Uncharacterized protein n=1 Tax=Dactylonectria macrodidyma TaxID=307937 RepID=A0A9P9JGL9_9HYPO|nr:hypothetical protein EDB81DRAFT_327198 [Dactylonectria macrodidyma]